VWIGEKETDEVMKRKTEKLNDEIKETCVYGRRNKEEMKDVSRGGRLLNIEAQRPSKRLPTSGIRLYGDLSV
jgi:hypothetical protein